MSSFNVIRALFCAAALWVCTTGVLGQPGSDEQLAKEWHRQLSAFLKASDTAVAIDLPTFAPPLGMSRDGNLDVAAMKRLAKVLQREAAFLANAIVLRRPPPHDPTRFGSMTTSKLTEWLLGASREELRRLFGEGVSFYALSEEGGDATALLASSSNGLMSAIAAGEPVRVSARIAPEFVLESPETGKVVRFTVDHIAPPMPDANDRAPNTHAEPLPASGGGDLDYGEGRVISLLQLISDAREKYKVNAVVDERILNTQVFLRGQFNRDSIREVLSFLTAIHPSYVGDWRRGDRIAALGQLFDGDLKDYAESTITGGYSGRDLIDGVEGTVGEFADRFPLLAEFVSQNGIDRNTRAKLDFSVVVNLAAQGSSISRFGRAWRDGVEVPSYEQNQVSFKISR